MDQDKNKKMEKTKSSSKSHDLDLPLAKDEFLKETTVVRVWKLSNFWVMILMLYVTLTLAEAAIASCKLKQEVKL